MKVVPCYHTTGSIVLETRRMGGQIYRLRQCKECGHRLATVEIPTEDGRMPIGIQSGRRKKATHIATWKDLGWVRSE